MPTEEVVQPTPTPEPSLAEYRKERETGEPAQEIPSAAAPEPEPAKTAAAPEAAIPETKPEAKGADNDTPKPRGGFQRRIDELTREKADLQRRNEEFEARLAALEGKANPAAEAQASDDPEPVLENFKTYEDWVRSHNRWAARQEIKAADDKAAKAEQAEQQKAQQKAVEEKHEAYSRAIPAVEEVHEDFREVLSDPKLVLPMYVQDAIKGMGAKGPEVAYQLAKNAEVRGKILDFFNAGDHQEAWFEFSVFVRSLTAKPSPNPVEKPVSSAPTPITPVGGGTASAELDPDKMGVSEYRKQRAAGRL